MLLTMPEDNFKVKLTESEISEYNQGKLLVREMLSNNYSESTPLFTQRYSLKIIPSFLLFLCFSAAFVHFVFN